MTIPRRALRTLCFRILYSGMFYGEEERKEEARIFLEQQEKLKPEDREEILARCLDIFSKLPLLDKSISEKTEGWRIERFSKVDLAIVRLALYEIRYDEESPERVAINEAVELAKIYGGEDSPKFVNGVLARLVRAEKKEGGEEQK